MARPTQTAKTRTGYGTSTTDGVQLVRAAQITPGFSESAANAQALASALGLAVETGGKIIQMKNQENLKAGVRDAQLGRVDQAKVAEFEAYANGVQSVRAQAEFLDSQSALKEHLEKYFDKSSGTLEELNQLIDGFYQDNFGDETDVAKLTAWAPMMAETRASIVGQYQQEIIAEQRNQVERDLYTIGRKTYENTGLFDADTVYQQGKVTLGKEGADKLVVSLATKLAAENGDTDVIDLIPEKWSDGSFSIKSDPTYDEALQNAKRQAQAQLEHNRNLMAQEEAARQKAVRDQTERLLVFSALDGKDVSSHLRQALADNILGAEDARAIYTFNQTLLKAATEDSVKPDGDYLLTLRMRLAAGDMTFEQLASSLNDPRAGFGTDRYTVAKDLINEWESAKAKAEQVKSDPELQTALSLVDRIYPPTNNLGFAGPLEGAANIQARAVADRIIKQKRALGQPVNPYEIPGLVAAEVKMVGLGGTEGIAQSAVQARLGVVAPLVQAAMADPASMTQLRTSFRTGVITSQQLQEAYTRGEISKEQLQRVISELKKGD